MIRILVALPPVDEQVAIAEYVEEKLRGMDSLVDDAERAVALLQERRSALIAAAVTGKIDVRHLADAEVA